jgi:hypothetical protein
MHGRPPTRDVPRPTVGARGLHHPAAPAQSPRRQHRPLPARRGYVQTARRGVRFQNPLRPIPLGFSGAVRA